MRRVPPKNVEPKNGKDKLYDAVLSLMEAVGPDGLCLPRADDACRVTVEPLNQDTSV